MIGTLSQLRGTDEDVNEKACQTLQPFAVPESGNKVVRLVQLSHFFNMSPFNLREHGEFRGGSSE